MKAGRMLVAVMVFAGGIFGIIGILDWVFTWAGSLGNALEMLVAIAATVATVITVWGLCRVFMWLLEGMDGRHE